MCRIKIFKRERDSGLALSEFPDQPREKWGCSGTAKPYLKSATTPVSGLLHHPHSPISSIENILGFAEKNRTLRRQRNTPPISLEKRDA
jgi:hypothetical protein